MPTERYEDVIKGPAERVTADGRPLEFAPDLVDQLTGGLQRGRRHPAPARPDLVDPVRKPW